MMQVSSIGRRRGEIRGGRRSIRSLPLLAIHLDMHMASMVMVSSTPSTVCGSLENADKTIGFLSDPYQAKTPDGQTDRASAGVCFGACDREVFADYDMTERVKPGADNANVVFFCLAGEQWHTICLYPYCWQEQPPAPPVTTVSVCLCFSCSLSPLIFISFFSNVFQFLSFNYYSVVQLRAAALCLTHISLCVPLNIDYIGYTIQIGVECRVNLLNVVTAILVWQQQLI